ncbi:MAG: type IV pilus modification protein PilV [Pseudomonadota bacterium]
MFLSREFRYRKQAGAGLIEVLVALVLISMGAIALGSTQISANYTGLQSMQRRLAVTLASDLLERMRGNRSALQHYHKGDLGGEGAVNDDLPARDCSALSCDSSQLARWDLYQWAQSLKGEFTGDAEGGLIKPLACVTVADREVLIQITWQGYRESSVNVADSSCDVEAPSAEGTTRHYLQLASWVGEK